MTNGYRRFLQMLVGLNAGRRRRLAEELPRCMSFQDDLSFIFD
jgi:hypothetical protein